MIFKNLLSRNFTLPTIIITKPANKNNAKNEFKISGK